MQVTLSTRMSLVLISPPKQNRPPFLLPPPTPLSLLLLLLITSTRTPVSHFPFLLLPVLPTYISPLDFATIDVEGCESKLVDCCSEATILQGIERRRHLRSSGP